MGTVHQVQRNLGNGNQEASLFITRSPSTVQQKSRNSKENILLEFLGPKSTQNPLEGPFGIQESSVDDSGRKALIRGECFGGLFGLEETPCVWVAATESAVLSFENLNGSSFQDDLKLKMNFISHLLPETSENTLLALVPLFKKVHFKSSGSIVYQRGKKSDGFFVVFKGEVKVALFLCFLDSWL